MVVDGGVQYEQFHDLLCELWLGGGLTRERVVVLFFFCSDLAIRLLQQGRDFVARCFDWSMRFVTEHVSLWVEQHGGWVGIWTVVKLTSWIDSVTDS